MKNPFLKKKKEKFSPQILEDVILELRYGITDKVEITKNYSILKGCYNSPFKSQSRFKKQS